MAKARENDAGTSPITRASGTKKVVLARQARNRRLADATQQRAFWAMGGSPAPRRITGSDGPATLATSVAYDNWPTGSSASGTAD